MSIRIFAGVVAFFFALTSGVGLVSAQALLFPVQGGWAVINGPPCGWGMGGHCATNAQRYAYDLVPLNSAGQPDMFGCTGKPVYSPSDGKIVAMSDGLPNFPNPSQHPAGNHVVIERNPSAYILIAHLSPNTIPVQVGDTVQAGTQIGECGNNGNSSNPHVHIHMQNSRFILDYQGAQGMEMYFTNLRIYQGWNCVPVAPNILLTRAAATC